MNQCFFIDNRQEFFSPLVGKYREITATCIKNLYLRLYGPEADYTYNLTRQDVLDIFIQSIRENPIVLEPETEVVEAVAASNEVLNVEKVARDIYNRLKKCAWIEEYMDPGMMETALRFTAHGRQFAIPFAQRHTEIITNTQHTRSTLSHLHTFINRLEENLISVGDLMIATKLAYEIIADFNELIEELVEKRRELMASVNAEIQQAKQAGDNFFDFMQKRFMPDIRFRFSADSVERYRHEILEATTKIRNLKDKLKHTIELEIRNAYPSLVREDRPVLLYWALDQIEYHVTTACDVKLPELRSETENFVRRAQALITHIASLTFNDVDNESIFNISRRFAELNCDQASAVLETPSARFGQIKVALYNPGKITPPISAHKETVDSRFVEETQMDVSARREAFIRHQLERVFAVEAGKISDYVIKQLAGGHKIKSTQLSITDVPSFLAALHAPQLASVSGGEKPYFRIHALDQTVTNEYFSSEGFELEYLPPHLHSKE